MAAEVIRLGALDTTNKALKSEVYHLKQRKKFYKEKYLEREIEAQKDNIHAS